MSTTRMILQFKSPNKRTFPIQNGFGFLDRKIGRRKLMRPVLSFQIRHDVCSHNEEPEVTLLHLCVFLKEKYHLIDLI
ncbi:unnamed protein product [Albugo candida]|uniref:Uncharacterized protein n=1 Tax=Albugo candida TaxID=65357 RepID=A0A024FTY9_9STRA|nr:unnamed protein product [Albugo candida]|eukprot:CCI10134.1 unnamed protein product [Albugo candida]